MGKVADLGEARRKKEERQKDAEYRRALQQILERAKQLDW